MLLLGYCHSNRFFSSTVALQTRLRSASEKCKRSRGGKFSVFKYYVARRGSVESKTSSRLFSTLIVWPHQTQTYSEQYTSPTRRYLLPKNLHQLIAIQQEERRQRQTELLQFTRNHVKRRIDQILSQTETENFYFEELVRKKIQQQGLLIPEVIKNDTEIFLFPSSSHHEGTMQLPIIPILDNIGNSDSLENTSNTGESYNDYASNEKAFTETQSETPRLKTNNGMQMDNIQKIPNILMNNDLITSPEENTASDGDEELVYRALIADLLAQNNQQINRIMQDEKSPVDSKEEEKGLLKLLYYNILELLKGVNQRKYQLKTADFNIILSALMLSSYGVDEHTESNDEVETDNSFSFDAAENMHTVYQHMKDLSKSSNESLIPNINTVCMVSCVLLREGARSAAATIWGDFLSQKSSPSCEDEQKKKKLNVVLDDQSLTIGIKCLTSAGKTYVGHVETLIENAAGTSRYPADEYGHVSTQVIPEDVLFNVIKYYVDIHEPEKLWDLVQLCIRSRHYDNKTMNQIIKQSLRLGKIERNQSGTHQLERIKHCECILDVLLQEREYFIPHISLWKLLLNTLSHLSRQNPSSCFPMIAEACQMMIAQKENRNTGINDGLLYFPGYLVIQAGIDAAGFVQSPQLAVDLLKWGWNASDNSFRGRGSTYELHNDTATPEKVNVKNGIEETSHAAAPSHDASDNSFSGIGNTYEHDNDFGTTTPERVIQNNSIKKTSVFAAPSDDMEISKEAFSFEDLLSDFLSNYNEDKNTYNVDDTEEKVKIFGGFAEENSQTIVNRSNKMSASILFSVLHLCLSQGNITLAYETLRYCIDSAFLKGDYPTFPKSIWAQFYRMVISCRAEKGESKEAKALLYEMQNYGIIPR